MNSRIELPLAGWVWAILDVLYGVGTLVPVLSAWPTGDYGESVALDWFVFATEVTNSALLLGAGVCLLVRSARSLRGAAVCQRVASWAFLANSLASIGLSLVIVNDSARGTFLMLGGLVGLALTSLFFWGSRYLARLAQSQPE